MFAHLMCIIFLFCLSWYNIYTLIKYLKILPKSHWYQVVFFRKSSFITYYYKYIKMKYYSFIYILDI